MFRRALITVVLGSVASLGAWAQNTGAQTPPSSGSPTPGTASASPAGQNTGTPATASPSGASQSAGSQSATAAKPQHSSSKKTKKNKSPQNPIANVDSKQPDKVLFDRAEEAIKHGKYDVARLSLQTLINTYPDSEYIARAKLAIGDSWYDEGGAAAMAQAESEYKDFITFFPNMPRKPPKRR